MPKCLYEYVKCNISALATDLKHQAIFDVEKNLAALAIIPDQDVQGVAILHPAQQTGIGSQRDDRISLDMQASLETICIH
jgi:hypothetical protein